MLAITSKLGDFTHVAWYSSTVVRRTSTQPPAASAAQMTPVMRLSWQHGPATAADADADDVPVTSVRLGPAVKCPSTYLRQRQRPHPTRSSAYLHLD